MFLHDILGPNSPGMVLNFVMILSPLYTSPYFYYKIVSFSFIRTRLKRVGYKASPCIVLTYKYYDRYFMILIHLNLLKHKKE